MADYRIFVEKKEAFRVEAESLRRELNENLTLALSSLRYLNVYDLFGFTPELLEKAHYSVFGETVTDTVLVDDAQCTMQDVLGMSAGAKYLAVEYLPGQFDQRASSAVDCVHLIDPEAAISIRSSRLLIFPESLTDAELARIRHYYINAVEAREKDLSVLRPDEQADVKPLQQLPHFTEMQSEDDLQAFCREWGLAMNTDDLREVIRYFLQENRQPTETEIRILDTYWSDHCRHTTFTTCLTDIRIDESFMQRELKDSLQLFHTIRKKLRREEKPLCLMELATIGARYLRKQGLLDDMEVSEENNACSIFITVDVDGHDERWLLQFKNETHNHPTEIEPFGGASTCLGGAIRDPLSGRAYVYQAMRVTGAGDIYAPVADTLHGKLPQRIISHKAAAGYSSYGNQIGLATTHVREIYHPSYVAKRLEVGAVVGAVPASQVRRDSPAPGDVILLMGGRTGRDGIGGATGSSKEHTEASLNTCGSEVQKGNAPEERKIQRLFRRPEVTRLIKKSNDFGAGGVSVAIGELADGLDIYLDRVPTKYAGLNPTELAISESQERMAVVVERKDMDAMMDFCRRDNIEVTHVADVTDTAHMRQFYKGEVVADLSRAFIDSAGAKHYAKATILPVEDINPFLQHPDGNTLLDRCCTVLSDKNVTSQKGLIENFDATIGRSTVLMPFGGKTQRSETQVSLQKLPTDGFTDTASVMAFGFNPYISEWSPYHGAAYSVIEACAKVAAAGADYRRMRFSYQEYFERMTSDPHTFGKPLAALLGALKMQVELGLPSIGGKDSMSGTFENISVPPTLIAFGITTMQASKAVSTEFKQPGHYIYLLEAQPLANRMPNLEDLTHNWRYLYKEAQAGHISSAYALGFGGILEALVKCAAGNLLGVDVQLPEEDLFKWQYGNILITTPRRLHYRNARLLGQVIDGAFLVNGEMLDTDTLYSALEHPFSTIYPSQTPSASNLPSPLFGWRMLITSEETGCPQGGRGAVLAYLPVFPGTNCDYDSAKAWRAAGAEVATTVFRNLTPDDVLRSIDEMVEHLDRAHILMLAGGFSAGDEPDGSGKFIASVLCNAKVAAAIDRLLQRGGLILGICNGFQALIKSGLLPYGKAGSVTTDSPTLFRNDINRHVSQMVTTRVMSDFGPWLQGLTPGEQHTIAVSHGEGKFVVSDAMAKELFEQGRVAFCYADPITGEPTMDSPANPNGSSFAIEGILSPDGHILGKMGHSERYEDGVFRNIAGNKSQPLFENAVRYFQSTQSGR